eukprot:38127-Chlamydomonas_euryale.AAC.5
MRIACHADMQACRLEWLQCHSTHIFIPHIPDPHTCGHIVPHSPSGGGPSQARVPVPLVPTPAAKPCPAPGAGPGHARALRPCSRAARAAAGFRAAPATNPTPRRSGCVTGRET